MIDLVGPDNVTIVSTEGKIDELRGRPLRVDTGDPQIDKDLSGYRRVRTGYGTKIVYKVAA